MMTLRVDNPQECLSMMFDNGQQGSAVVSLRCRDIHDDVDNDGDGDDQMQKKM